MNIKYYSKRPIVCPVNRWLVRFLYEANAFFTTINAESNISFNLKLTHHKSQCKLSNSGIVRIYNYFE